MLKKSTVSTASVQGKGKIDIFTFKSVDIYSVWSLSVTIYKFSQYASTLDDKILETFKIIKIIFYLNWEKI